MTLRYMTQTPRGGECAVIECRLKAIGWYKVETEMEGTRIPVTLGVCAKHQGPFLSPPVSYVPPSPPILDARARSTRTHDP